MTNLDSIMVVGAVMDGLRECPFLDAISQDVPKDLSELMSRSQQYIALEEFKAGRKEEALQRAREFWKEESRQNDYRDPRRGEQRTKRKPDRALDKPPCSGDHKPQEPRRPRPLPRYNNYTPLNTSREKILLQIQSKKILKQPEPIKESNSMKSSKKFCTFHQIKSHTTKDSIQLRDATEDLIRNRKFDQFLKEGRTKEDDPPDQQNPPEVEVPLHFIEGPGCEGVTSSSRKQYAQMIGSVQEVLPQERKRPSSPITFIDEDLHGVVQPHDDTLVVTVKVGIFMMSRVLIYTGRSVDIIFWDAFERMKIGAENLKPMKSPLMGINGSPLQPEEVITLLLTLGTPRTVTAMINFLVVRCRSSYNAIIGRPSLNTLGVVPSTYHMKLKFQTRNGRGEVWGNQSASCQCYATFLKNRGKGPSQPSEALTLEEL
ncbi:hypothetical protein J5N97_028473 [Dioscorea zingiberensis]|uniref:Uncharacterized protein n=1 Tax=Dioscorea zingiberensis TaxID=325984 RepID=A0A9D5BYL0_9LILI|nr:hypothetical protein J5N97_028473 [Dioscorea zingiberensis]